MSRPTRNERVRTARSIGLVVAAAIGTACIIKVEPNLPSPDPVVIERPVPFPVPIEPPSPDTRSRVQILWQFAMSPATALYASRFEEWIGIVVRALAERNIVPQVVVAPLYARNPIAAHPRGAWDWGATTPTFFSALPHDVLAAMADDIDPRDARAPEQAVIAALGKRLASTRIEGRVADAGFVTFESPFTKAPRLLVVISVSPWPRRCAADAPECALDGAPPVDFFSGTSSDGGLTWLSYGGGARLAPGEVVHVAIATREDLSGPALVSACASEPNFPGEHLDILEPAGARYYTSSPFTFFDYCAVMSDPNLLYEWARELRVP